MKLLPVFASVLLLASISTSEVVFAHDLRAAEVEPCVNAYYGIGEPVDYSKAYKCFQENDVHEFLIIMELNGEGTPRDPKLAEQNADAWFKKDIGMGEDHQLRMSIQQHLKDPRAPRVEFCNDIAFSMYSIGFCSGVDDALGQQESDLAMKKIRATLEPAQQIQWDKIEEAFGRYQKAEGNRIYKRYEQGTIRGVAYDSQMDYVRGNFQKLMVMVFSNKKLSPAAAVDSKALDMKVQTAYQTDLDKYAKGVSYLNGPKSLDNDKQEYARDIAEYKEDAEASQKDWETLRDLCSQLAASVYKKAGTDWSASMSAAMSEQRLLDIQDDPVGSG